MKNDKNRASSTVLSFIKSAIRTQTLDEMAAALHFTPKRTRYLIDRYHLDRYCIPPKTDRVWDLIKEDRVQCAVCGMWMQAINGAHRSEEHTSELQSH